MSSFASSKPSKAPTLRQIALGNLSNQQLVAGAKKERALTIYYTDTGTPALLTAFEKKYPFIHVNALMEQGTALSTQVKNDYQSNSDYPDILVQLDIQQNVMEEARYLQPFMVPSAAPYKGAYVKTAKGGGDFYVTMEDSPLGFAWNTKLLPASEVPSTLQGLLASDLAGKLAISGHSTGIDWVGEVIHQDGKAGQTLLEKLGENHSSVENVSGSALAGLVASGAVVASPTVGIVDAVSNASAGAPIKFKFLKGDPSDATINAVALGARAPDPYAALLFINYALSSAGQSLIVHKANWFSALPGSATPDTAVAGIPDWSKALQTADLVNPAKIWPYNYYEQAYTVWQDLVSEYFKG